MTIQGIQDYRMFDTKLKLSKKKTDTNAIPKKSDKIDKKDTYEPSKTEDRNELLKSIKKKIKSGFYDSKKVAEDLSESFADVFNQIL
jgi:anti-sigma28 factor (negative regulator of flagellin synthesis)